MSQKETILGQSPLKVARASSTDQQLDGAMQVDGMFAEGNLDCYSSDLTKNVSCYGVMTVRYPFCCATPFGVRRIYIELLLKD